MEANRQEAAAIVQARNDNDRRRKLVVTVRRLGCSGRLSDCRTDGRAVQAGGEGVEMNASFLA